MYQPSSPLPLPRRARVVAQKRGWHGFKDLVCAFSLLALVLLAHGCGGGGGSSASAPAADAPPELGELFIGITDAEGDFLRYAVDVEALTLERANGDVVETLPLTTRIDFTELTEVTEFLSIATVPAGVYESVTLSMDFGDADIVAQDANGDAVALVARDSTGAPLGLTNVTLNLSSGDVVRVRVGIPAAFSLDFDLDASNEIDLANAEVIVEPFLLATPELEEDREHRVRGVLEAVDTDASTFDLAVRPFRHRTGQFGEFTVSVDDATRYEVDGVGFTGAAGLEAMSQLDARAPVVANGAVDGVGLQAEVVLAGSSVPWSDADVVKGVVAARSGDELIVRGARIEFSDGTEAFRGSFTVNLSDTTGVSAPGIDNTLLSKDSISVGQRLVAWGEFVDDETLDAARVRMHMNQLTAEVVEAEPLAVSLFYLNGRRPAAYDFAGTGVTPADDADPAFYEIDTATLPGATIEGGDLVRVRGLVNEFGAAPADFNARTVIDVDTDMRGALLKISWESGTSTPFTNLSSERVDVDLTEARKLLAVRGVPRDFIELMDEVGLVAPASGMGVYAVKVRGAGEVHVYRSFADLTAELMAQLDAGRLLHRISAQGRYNVGSAELTTGRAGFVFSSTDE